MSGLRSDNRVHCDKPIHRPVSTPSQHAQESHPEITASEDEENIFH